ncbi:monovalent cation/H+ antiporter subunit A [Paracoccus sp. (in: a-proteobacteria)]|uniref:monovalent cation/H+ antiporter subunit A n=1 Tax=Paracoccus sp. TaxID=267 RepID=UPI0026E07400|nr:monovalent cation/H+ antiporter subunit A [Paracoccus sp. (in: a-proteobacteria)]MDO5647820.1 monovalent cation/H+ antiporter subunit A [Paracoccus sp. (in: a-proteobacteria)]
MIDQNLILTLVLLPFIASIACATLPQHGRTAAAWVSGLFLTGGLAIMAGLYDTIDEGRVIRGTLEWMPSIGLNLNFRMDGFAWMFVTLVLAIGVLVVLYARFYMSKTDPVPRFYSFLMAFTGAMVGMLLSGNIIMLVVFWELTSIFSFLLIGYWYQNQSARDGARMALIITATGGLALLLSMIVIGQIVGSYDLDRVLWAGDVIRAHPLYPLALVLFLLGAFTKSAQFPFHFWLPGAMAAPTPVSAFLHSATMVKAGVFLLIRFSPALGGSDLWFWLVTGTGMATLIIGSVVALFRHDLKGLLAYSTISHLGLITALAGIGSPAAIFAAIFHILNHAVFKASLFMSAGIIDHETGTRDMRKLSGMMAYLPITGTLVIIGSAAMAGLPPLNGFLSKEMFLTLLTETHNGSVLDNALPILGLISAIFGVAYSLRLVHAVFFGPKTTDLPNPTPHEPPAWMRRPVELLVAASVVIGLMPGLVVPVMNIAARSVVGPDMPYTSIYLWHGVNLPLILSILGIVIGGALYWAFKRQIAEGPEGPPLLHNIRGQRVFEVALFELTWRQPRVLHHLFGTERLQPQLRIMTLLTIAAVALILWGGPLTTPRAISNDLHPAFALMWIVGAACGVGAAMQAKYHRFASLVLLGGAGLVTCVTFAWFSAPDLAVTQLLVEIVTTVLLLLGLRWLPKRNEEIAGDRAVRARIRRSWDFLVASVAGFGVAMIAYIIMTRPLVPNVGDWFLRNAYYEGGGTNVVNVVLVDFRAFDTFGEIAVLTIVALTVYALLRRFRPPQDRAYSLDQQRAREAESLHDYLLVPSVIMRWMFPAIIMLSAYFFLRGHDLPGGGFAGGVTLAIALMLQYLGNNVRWVEARLNVLPIRWMGIGLLIALGTGLGAFAFGYPFLTAHAQYIDIPFIGAVPAATAMAFDVGVYMVVVGAVVLLLIAIAHQSLRLARLREHDADKDTAKETA